MRKWLLTSLLFFSFATQAAGFSYNNVSISYANVDLDIVDGDGFDFEGNFAVTDTIFIPVRYQSISYDFGFDTTMYAFGIGAHMPVAQATDLFGMLQLGNYELDTPGGGADDDFWALIAGIRTELSNTVEGTLYATLIDFDSNTSDDQSGVGAKLNIYFNKTTSLVARVEFLSDIDTISVGAQFDF